MTGGQGLGKAPSAAHEQVTLRDGADEVVVSVLAGHEPRWTVLFAAGAGGSPLRHLPLLTTLATAGCHVVAPHFPRLSSPTPGIEELAMRTRWLRLALNRAPEHLPVAGIGHSIGGALLLGLAGGDLWTISRDCLRAQPAARPLAKLVLFTPALQFLQAPHAVDAIQLPIQAWAASEDRITPPSQVDWLAAALAPRMPVQTHLAQGAGHFSFMDELPPHVTDPHPDRPAFLGEVAAQVTRFILA
ncbi:alpha/beta hydrolase [Massilia arenosa]|uniref:Alpha/beta hydrolase n=1 Tax=Zemynaea arenosa TaxID=2561931 RepID=A0A4Y9SEU0_9BURK|nr:alpha/beta hydrolase [Massilia arenosa]